MRMPPELTAPPTSVVTPPRWLSLLGHRGVQVAALMLFAGLLNAEGVRVPAGNEWIYLLYFFKAYHPAFLQTDWTMQETTAGHAVFNYGTGWLTMLMPLAAAAWVGRLACWAGAFVGLLRLGRHYRIPQWAVGLGVLLWMMGRQSFVTGDWIVGSFEAKCPAYIALLFALDAALRRRFVLSGVLCGVAFSFHTAVGMWGGAALGIAVLFDAPIRRTLAFAATAILFALPGLITSLPLIFGSHAISADDAKFWVTLALPLCFDPAAFPVGWIVLLGCLAAFAGWHARLFRGDRPVLFLATFQLATAAFFAFGLVARLLGRFDWVELFPLRVYAVLAPLLFFWQVASLLLRPEGRRSVPAAAAAVALTLALPSPIWATWDLIAMHLGKAREIATHDYKPATNDDLDFRTAARWVAAHTPTDAVVIAPPWRSDAYYELGRPLIANFHAPRYDRMSEWRQRLAALAGDTSHLTPADETAGDMGQPARDFYERLTPAAVADLRRRFGGDYLVTRGHYAYPARFTAGGYIVYDVAQVSRQ